MSSRIAFTISVLLLLLTVVVPATVIVTALTLNNNRHSPEQRYPVVAAPQVSVPPGVTPTTVTLFEWVQFKGYGGHSFKFLPPRAPKQFPSSSLSWRTLWSKIVVSMDCNCTAGRQFDRSFTLSIADALLLFGTTSEPVKNAGPAWTITSDITEFAPLLSTNQSGEMVLDTVVTKVYNGVLSCRAKIDFFPASEKFPAPNKNAPSIVVPLGMGQTVLTVNVSSLPRQIGSAYLSVFVQNQHDDEFFWSCLPDGKNLSDLVGTCGHSSLRFAKVSIDGAAAAVVPVMPYIFSGGIDPGLWMPTLAARTLNLVPLKVDLSCFAGILASSTSSESKDKNSNSSTGGSGGDKNTTTQQQQQHHTIQIEVGPTTNPWWVIGATLFVFPDRDIDKVTLMTNTLPTSLQESGNGSVSSNLHGNASKGLALGWANVSYFLASSCSALIERFSRRGRPALVEHRTQFTFYNKQFYNSSGNFQSDNESFSYSETLSSTSFETTIKSTHVHDDVNNEKKNRMSSPVLLSLARTQFNFPLKVIQNTVPDPANKSLVNQFTSVDQAFQIRGSEVNTHNNGSSSSSFVTDDHVASSDTMVFDAAQSYVVENTNQSGHNDFLFRSNASCFDRSVSSANNSVVKQSTDCNEISWDEDPFAMKTSLLGGGPSFSGGVDDNDGYVAALQKNNVVVVVQKKKMERRRTSILESEIKKKNKASRFKRLHA